MMRLPRRFAPRNDGCFQFIVSIHDITAFSGMTNNLQFKF
jgi:hypothetical protein